MQQTSDVNNDAEALCCFRLVQSVRVQNVTCRRKCHPTHWFRCEHYSEQPSLYIRTYFHSLKDRLTWVASGSYNHTDGWDTNLSVPAQRVVTGTDVSSYILRDS
ncbi:hypothetical protein C0J52_11335 [Blattella germanica]|nr:hypothetical protein C0J52_11335 [Blattella germanica]